MSRIRTIKPEFWSDEKVMKCSHMARLAFIGLWNFCDDGGNHPASLATLKAEVFPSDSCSEKDMQSCVDELSLHGLLLLYEADSKTYWHVTGWHHQKIQKPNYRFPTPVLSQTGDSDSYTDPENTGTATSGNIDSGMRLGDSVLVDSDACNSDGRGAARIPIPFLYQSPPEGNGMEGNGMEKNLFPLQEKSCTGKRLPAVQFDFSSGKFANLDAHIPLWKAAYPAVDLMREINRAAAWLIANKDNRKRNYTSFLNRWLTKAQDHAPRVKKFNAEEYRDKL